ncbi:DUF6916 family protein [Rugamonas sp. CCM 8940]|uniref:DUF6916 family protein n=1 Tax=Rugamonas sp. CCM 8940 TaxID=2765359 RepID=UPI0018F3AC8F|nr:hypothetical protein [Rugamonas sp. CCM 8940]MBJ7309369.1 hypothetical protein [Rugamonas sp. CCM 8940]
MMKRRELLKKIGGSSLALAGLGLAAAPSRAGAADADGGAGSAGFVWSQAAASALVGQPFWLNHPEFGAVSLTLEAVRGVAPSVGAAPATPATPATPVGAAAAPAVVMRTAPPASAAVPRTEQFSLYFVGPRGAQATQGNYDLDHQQIGRFTLLLLPGEPRPGATVYRADFSLLL